MELPYQLQEIIPYFEELHEKVFKKNRDGGCTTRAQLLYLILEKKGMNPKILRYFVKGEEEKDESVRIKVTLISGQKFSSHVVVFIDNYIFDPNISKVYIKNEWENEVELKSNAKIICKEYNDRKIDYDLCRQCVEKYNLELFRFLFD